MMREARARSLTAVLTIMRAVAGHHRRDDLFPAITGTVKDLLRCDRVGIVLVDATEQMIDLHFDPPVQIESRAIDDYLSGVDHENRRGAHLVTLDQLAAFPVHRRMWERHGIRSSIVIPIVVEDRVVGALACMSRDPRDHVEADLDLATDIGAVVAVAVDNCLAYEHLARLREEANDDQAALRAELATELRDEDLIGNSAAFAPIRQQLALVAATDATVLITGESGTGKDVVARTIHASSPRRARPMIAVNCAALPAGLAESELFGHEEGAFTGATRARTGRFELADQGTLFLDEVAELSLEVQAKLLRVLQEREYERVGGGSPVKIDVRIIAATNRDLSELVAEDRFREDLYYRLRVFPIHVPPLRARTDDLPQLVAHFARRAAQRLRVPERRVTAEAMRRLADYAWPGNVRELQNAIERAMILSRGDTLDVDAVVPRQLAALRIEAAPPALRQQYLDALEAAQWVIEGAAGAAARLGLHPNTLRHRLKRLGIERPRG